MILHVAAAQELISLGAVVGGLGHDFGAKMGLKIDQRTDQKLEAISRSIFGATPEF